MAKFVIITSTYPKPSTQIRWVQPRDTISSFRYRYVGDDSGCSRAEMEKAEQVFMVDINNNSKVILKDKNNDGKLKVYYKIKSDVKHKEISNEMINSFIETMTDLRKENLEFDSEDDAIQFLMM